MSRDADRNAAAERAAELFCQAGAGRAWFVFHARPRCEKKVARACLDLQIHHYLPLHKSVGRKRKRRYSFEVPLFPGYLFGCCDAQERLDLVHSGYLVRSIEVTDQQRLLDELHNIYLASCGEVELASYPQLKRGRLVQVRRGPLAGVKGRISKRKEDFRLVLNVSILGTAVAAELDMENVEAI